jgi:hypothetical protein
MAKKKRRKLASAQPEIISSEKQASKKWHPVFAGIGLVLFILIYHAPMAFDGLSPIGTDIIGGKGGTHQIEEFEKQTGNPALWNPYVFSGMPNYHRLRFKFVTPIYNPINLLNLHDVIYLYADSYKKGLNAVINYCIGAIGMLFLMQYFGVPLWGSVLASLAFILIPHFEVLIQAGHFQKFRAIMLIPWVHYSFSRYFNKGKLLNFLLCVLVISVQFHTQHYQMIFYTLMLLCFVGVSYIFRSIREKTGITLLRRFGMFLVAILLAFSMNLQPLMSVREYMPYSIRGGTGEAGSKGLDYDYATGWSFSPKEMISLLMPYAYGGASIVTYHGNDVPQLQGRQIPGYWGDMPSTEGGEYVGILTFILGIIGIVYAFRQKQGEWIALALFIPFALLLSFGRHVPLLYKLFFEHVPVFNKFRVPSMVLDIVYYLFPLFTGISFIALFEDKKEKQWIGKLTIGVGGFLILLALSPFMFRGMFGFERAGEAASYGKQGMELVKAARYDLFKGDAIRLLLLAIPGCAAVWLFVQKIIPSTVAWVALSLLILADFLTVDKRFLNNLGSLATLEATHFARTPTDRFLNEDAAIYRVFALEQDAFQDNQMSYYHQSVGGYNPAKPRIYQDVIENCIYGWTHSRLPINWHVLDMLNTKYIVAPGLLEEDHLEMVFQDARNKKVTYRNLNNPGRAWFVSSVEQITDRNQRLQRLNDPGFHPDSVAILEKPLPVPIQEPGDTRVEVSLFKPDSINLRVDTDVQSLLVVSGIYYPKGWTAWIDGKETEIYKTDHILRSLIVPSGQHDIEMGFSPETFSIVWVATRLSRALFWLFVYIFIAALLLKKRTGRQ